MITARRTLTSNDLLPLPLGEGWGEGAKLSGNTLTGYLVN